MDELALADALDFRLLPPGPNGDRRLAPVTVTDSERPATEGVKLEGAEERNIRAANRWARRTALIVLVLGGIPILIPTLTHLGTVWQNPFRPSETETTVVKTGPGSAKTTTVTRAEADRSFVERALAAGGLLLLRIGLLALAAFLAGAIVQRVILGDFALKVGPLEVPELKRTAAESAELAENVERRFERQSAAIKRAMDVAAASSEGIAQLERRLGAIEGVLARFTKVFERGPSEDDSEEESPTDKDEGPTDKDKGT